MNDIRIDVLLTCDACESIATAQVGQPIKVYPRGWHRIFDADVCSRKCAAVIARRLMDEAWGLSA